MSTGQKDGGSFEAPKNQAGVNGAPPSTDRIRSGKPLVIAVLALAVVLAVGAVVYYRYVSRQAGDYFGPEDGNLIVKASVVELLVLGDAEQAAEAIELVGRKYAVAKRIDVTKAKGLHNLRQALLTDATYEWPTGLPGDEVWRYALVFRDGRERCVVLLSEDCFLARSVRRDGTLLVRMMEPPKGSDPELPRPSPFRVFFQEQLAAAESR
jgi:hypothetical protein